MMLVTFNFPVNQLPSFNPQTQNLARGAAPLTPNALNQVTVDVSQYTMDVMLDAGFVPAMLMGTTAQRPVFTSPGVPYLDTTLGYVIWRDPTNNHWINSAGATV